MPAQGRGNREEPLRPIRSSSTFALDIPETQQNVAVDVDLVPAENLPEDFADLNTNVAKVNLEGRDFYALIGKTRAVE